jgi:hypothetical protein
MHSAAHTNNPECACLKDAAELGVKWPDLPWTCPDCRHEFAAHSHTTAVVEAELIDKARRILVDANRVLETRTDGEGKPLQPADLARARMSKVAAEDMIAHPAHFACSGCLVTAVQIQAKAGAILDLLAR